MPRPAAQVLKKLAKDGLSTEKREKAAMYVEDLVDQVASP
jgi:hypothetical protein